MITEDYPKLDLSDFSETDILNIKKFFDSTQVISIKNQFKANLTRAIVDAEMKQCHFILDETCHFCDLSTLTDEEALVKKYCDDLRGTFRGTPMTKNERTLTKYGWKFDVESLMNFVDYRKFISEERTRMFLNDVHETERLYGEHKYPMFLGDDL